MSEFDKALDELHEEIAQAILDIRQLGNDLVQALLDMRCDCPNYGPCQCQRAKAIDAWVEATR